MSVDEIIERFGIASLINVLQSNDDFQTYFIDHNENVHAKLVGIALDNDDSISDTIWQDSVDEAGKELGISNVCRFLEDNGAYFPDDDEEGEGDLDSSDPVHVKAEELCLAAVQENGEALQYVPEALREQVKKKRGYKGTGRIKHEEAMSMSDAALAKETLFYTYKDYKEWELAPGERYELIDGVAYAMASPNAYHQAISMELSSQFHVFLRGKPCKVYPAPYDVRLFYEKDESDDTVVQPDITLICDARKRGPEGCRGAPDLVVEIVSPSNTGDEMARKFELYRRAGVREYWVVYPKTKSLHVHLFENGAITTWVYSAKDTVCVNSLPGLEITLEPVFAE